MSGVIKAYTHLHGAKYWAQWFEQRKPRFEVFRYVGYNRDKGLYYFQSTSENVLIVKNTRQLGDPMFRPFCYESKLIFERGDQHAVT